MSDPHNHKDQFRIVQNLQMSPIPQTSFLVGAFFAVSYSKTALIILIYLYTFAVLIKRLLKKSKQIMGLMWIGYYGAQVP